MSERRTLPVDAAACFVLARLWSRDETAERLDRYGFRGSAAGEAWREHVLSTLDEIRRVGDGWHRDRSSPPSACGRPSGEESSSSIVMSGDTMTTMRAAEILGVSARRVRQLIDAGLLPAERVGRDLHVDAAAVAARAAEMSEEAA